MTVRDCRGRLAAIRSPLGEAAPPDGYRPVGAPYRSPTRRLQIWLGLLGGLITLVVLGGMLVLLAATLDVTPVGVLAFWTLWLAGFIAFAPIYRLAHEALHAGCFRGLVGAWPRVTVWGDPPSISYPGWRLRRDWFLAITLAPLAVLPPAVLALGGLAALAVGPLIGRAGAAAVTLMAVYLAAMCMLGALGDVLEAWHMRRAPAAALVNEPQGWTAQAYVQRGRSDLAPAGAADTQAPPR